MICEEDVGENAFLVHIAAIVDVLDKGIFSDAKVVGIIHFASESFKLFFVEGGEDASNDWFLRKKEIGDGGIAA